MGGLSKDSRFVAVISSKEKQRELEKQNAPVVTDFKHFAAIIKPDKHNITNK